MFSIFTGSGALQPSVIQSSTPITARQNLRNPGVVKALTADGSSIADWAKFTTQSFESPAGPFQVRFYRNATTGATNYTIDYKVLISGG